MKTFNYKPSLKIIHWGCCFDSLLELKYAISIQDEYSFLRSPLSIYFDFKTLIPSNYIRTNTRRYTPDFLIRHKVTGVATLVELKPRGFDNANQLSIRRQVCENFIRWKKLDWTSITLYDDQVKLNTSQQEKFNRFCKIEFRTPGAIRHVDDNFQSRPSFFRAAPDNKLVQFGLYGKNSL